MVATAKKIAESTEKYPVSGLSTAYLGDLLYSDFSKNAITRDVSEGVWQDSLNILESATGSLLVSGGNAYALPSPRANELMALFRRFCDEHGMLSDPDDCFRYLKELPERHRQLSMFDL